MSHFTVATLNWYSALNAMMPVFLSLSGANLTMLAIGLSHAFESPP
jgi:hypothetical protein